MSVAVTNYGHVFLDSRGRPCVGASSMKVTQLVAEHAAYGWSPEELCFQHPDLTLAQVHSALAYYWDHARELDEVIEAEVRQIDERLRAAQPVALLAKLRLAPTP